MRLVLFCPVFVRPSETFIFDLATELDADGVDVSVIAADRQLVEERPFDTVTIVPRPDRWSWDRIARRLRGLVRKGASGEILAETHRGRLRPVIQRHNPDIILAEYGQSGVLVAPIAQELGFPLVVSFHGEDATRAARDPNRRIAYKNMFARAAAVTGPSNYIRERLIDLGCPPDRAHVQHNGVRLDRMTFRPAYDRYAGGTIEFLFVGRLTPKKDPISLLRSFAYARTKVAGTNLRLTIAGDGPLRDDVEREVRTLGLSEHTRIMGKMPHNEIIELFGDSHIYVQHSVTAPSGDEEGLPVSITEALAIGLPVISTRHSGIPEVVRDGETGLLVDEGDIENMSQRMADLASDPDKWHDFGVAGRQLLEREFAMPVVLAEFRTLLASVTN
jgi:colanic acid/amylovoran biosynthesis glycosyltransferase